MARPDTISFGKFLVLLGDGATPTEVFTAPCGFTDKSLDMNADTNSTALPDCDNPDVPAWNVETVKSLNAAISGQGVLAQAAQPIWRAWFVSGLPKNIRVKIDLPLANGGGYWAGPAILTQFKMDSSYGDKVKISVSIKNADAWVWVPATA